MMKAINWGKISEHVGRLPLTFWLGLVEQVKIADAQEKLTSVQIYDNFQKGLIIFHNQNNNSRKFLTYPYPPITTGEMSMAQGN